MERSFTIDMIKQGIDYIHVLDRYDWWGGGRGQLGHENETVGYKFKLMKRKAFFVSSLCLHFPDFNT